MRRASWPKPAPPMRASRTGRGQTRPSSGDAQEGTEPEVAAEREEAED